MASEETLAHELEELRLKCNEAEHMLHQRELIIARMEDVVGAVIKPRPLVVDAVTCTATDFIVPHARSASTHSPLPGATDPSSTLANVGLGHNDPFAAGIDAVPLYGGFVSPQLQVARLERLLAAEHEAYSRERNEYVQVLRALADEAAALRKVTEGLSKMQVRRQ